MFEDRKDPMMFGVEVVFGRLSYVQDEGCLLLFGTPFVVVVAGHRKVVVVVEPLVVSHTHRGQTYSMASSTGRRMTDSKSTTETWMNTATMVVLVDLIGCSSHDLAADRPS
jgi:hypothetical protein